MAWIAPITFQIFIHRKIPIPWFLFSPQNTFNSFLFCLFSITNHVHVWPKTLNSGYIRHSLQTQGNILVACTLFLDFFFYLQWIVPFNFTATSVNMLVNKWCTFYQYLKSPSLPFFPHWRQWGKLSFGKLLTLSKL